MKSKRVILDTNLWIYFLISGKLDEIDNHILKGNLKVIFSQELIEEFTEVTSRPKFKKYFSFHDIANLLRLFDIYGEIIHVTSRRNVCRDPKDNFLLDLAVDSKADYLVTGDNDLLVLQQVDNTKIITIQELLTILKKA
jgi:uncharacterized protein